MKKSMFNFLFLVLCFSFISCGTSDNAAVDNSPAKNGFDENSPYNDGLNVNIDYQPYKLFSLCNMATALQIVSDNTLDIRLNAFENFGFQYEIIETFSKLNEYEILTKYYLIKYSSDIDNPAWQSNQFGIYNAIDEKYLIEYQQITIDEISCNLTCKKAYVFNDDNFVAAVIVDKINKIANHNDIELNGSILDKRLTFSIIGTNENLKDFDNVPCNY